MSGNEGEERLKKLLLLHFLQEYYRSAGWSNETEDCKGGQCVSAHLMGALWSMLSSA